MWTLSASHPGMARRVQSGLSASSGKVVAPKEGRDTGASSTGVANNIRRQLRSQMSRLRPCFAPGSGVMPSDQGATVFPLLVAGRDVGFHVDAVAFLAGQKGIAVLARPAIECQGGFEGHAAGIGLVAGHIEPGGQFNPAAGFQGHGNGEPEHHGQIVVRGDAERIAQGPENGGVLFWQEMPSFQGWLW